MCSAIIIPPLVSISIGKLWNDSLALAAEVDQFMNEHDDFLVIIAAGNDGPRWGTLGAPATAKNCLAVGMHFVETVSAMSYLNHRRDSFNR